MSSLRLKQSLRLLPFGLILGFMLFFYFSDLYKQFSFENLKRDHDYLKQFVKLHPWLSPLLFMTVYVLSVCLIIPDSTVLTLLGGALFPLPLAIFYTAFAETLGAWIFFISLEWALGRKWMSKQQTFLARMQKDFNENAANYMLSLRLSHLVPFWLINVAAAYFRLRSWTFLWTTFLGVLPLSYLFSTAGHRLSDIFAQNETLTLMKLFNTQMKLLLLLFSLCALAPLLYKKFFKKK